MREFEEYDSQETIAKALERLGVERGGMGVGAVRPETGRVGLTIRGIQAGDLEDIREMLMASGAFNDVEVQVALEMAESGLKGDYTLFGAQLEDRLRGYVCIGKAPLTLGSWYLYWICVHPDAQGFGVGRALQERVEAFVCEADGNRLVLETSGRPDYGRTRRFYEQAGFVEAGRIPDFYKPGDDCVVYWKPLAGSV